MRLRQKTYQDIACDISSKFDISNFPKDHPSGIEAGHNKKVVGMFKDEAGGEIIEEFVGLRATLYSCKLFAGKEEKKCKGITKPVVRHTITHDDFKECLFSGKEQMRSMNVIRSHKHNICTERINKLAMSATDDKRIINEGHSTWAYGYYKLNEQNCPSSVVTIIEMQRPQLKR